MKAVVFIDVQNDFVKGGALPFAYPEKDNVPQILSFAKACRNRGWQLFATADTHKKETYLTDTLEGKLLPVEHCLEGTEGHKIVQGLVKDENGDVLIPQGHIFDKSTFGSQELAWGIRSIFEILKEPLEEIIICGYCTSICVAASAILLRATFPDTKITVRADLCGDVSEEAHHSALTVMRMQQISIQSHHRVA